MFPPVHQTLLQDSTVQSLIGSAIYRHDDAASDIVGDYAVWSVSGAPLNNLSDLPPVDQWTVSVTVWSDDDQRVETIAQAIRDALEPVAHLISIPVDNRDRGATKRYRITMQFDWWFSR
jgi:hypothetical protein